MRKSCSHIIILDANKGTVTVYPRNPLQNATEQIEYLRDLGRVDGDADWMEFDGCVHIEQHARRRGKPL